MNEFQAMCKLEELVTERIAMQAANQERERRGLAQAYDERAFLALADGIKVLAESVTKGTEVAS